MARSHRLRFESLEPRLLLDGYTALPGPAELQSWAAPQASLGSSLGISGTAHTPTVPAASAPVWVTSSVAGSENAASVSLTYRTSSAGSTSKVFAETMGATAVAKPWNGSTGADQSWTVTGGSYFDLRTGANYTTSTTQCGLFYKGGSSLNALTGAMVATTKGLNAAGGSGYVEFYVRTQTLDKADGWTFQVDSGSGFVTRLSELTGISHDFQKYHYDLAGSELVNGLKLRFQFTGGGVGDTDDRISLDQVTVLVTPGSAPVSVAMFDDGAHGDGAARDGVYGVQIPAQTIGTTVSYHVTAVATGGWQLVDPAGAPGVEYSYTVSDIVPFDGNIVLGCPTDASITLNVLSTTQNRDVYFAYGTASKTNPSQTATFSLAAGTPLVVTLDSLSADTQYFYRMYSKPAGASSALFTGTDEYSFHTQRAPGSTFVFSIQGDSHPERVNSQFDAALYARTLATAAADQPDFYLTSGDDFSVDQLDPLTVTPAQVAERYLIQRPYLGLIGNSAPLFLVNGNHEQAARYLLDGTPDNVAVWAQNARNLYYSEPAPDGFYTGNTESVQYIQGDKLRNYFAWTWGDALFVTIDPYWSSPTCVDDPFDGGSKRSNLWDIQHGDAQYAWLKSTLEESTAKYKFVFAHHVLGTGRGGAELAGGYEWGGQNSNGTWGFDVNRPNWEQPIHQLLAATGVTAFIQGHDHIFVDQELDGVHYITLPEPADPNYYLYNADAFGLNVQAQASNTGYTRFTVSPAGVQVEYIRTFLPADETFGRTNGLVAASFTLEPASGLPVITGRMPSPATPTPADSVWVTSTVTDNGSVASVNLTYQAGAGAINVAMYDDGRHGDGAAGDHIFGGLIPAQAAGTLVQYTITAVDNAGNQATSGMSYTVAPLISNTATTPSQPLAGNSVWVTSTVTDHLALGRVTLTYQVGAAVAVSTPMYDDGAHGDGAAGDHVYGGQIPAQVNGTTVSYYVTATDETGVSSNAPTTAPTDRYSYRVGYPYDVILGRPTDDSLAVSVMSRVSDTLSFYVAYGTTAGAAGAQTSSRTLAAGGVATLELTGLQPNSTYYYRVYCQVAGGTGFQAGAEQAFHTQRAAGATFTFDVQADIHYSDPDSNSLAVYQSTAANIAADNADFLIDLGDTFMTEKYGVNTQAGIAAAVQAARANEFSLVGDSTPVLLATGNHESELGWLINDTQPHDNAAVWATAARETYFPAPIPGDFYSGSPATDPFVQEARTSYYAYTWGNAQFIVLDPFWYTDPKPRATDGGWGWTLGQTQYDWLQRTLAASQSPFKFVFIHQLVGGDYDNEARGGLEFSKFTEWGGYNQDGTWGFDTHRPGWAMPIQNLLLNYGVNVVFHGHDHLFVKQNLDSNADGAADLVYLECPQPASPIYGNTGTAASYGYTNFASDAAGHSGLQGGSGHIRVTVAATSATIDYVRAYAAADQTSQRVNGSVAYSFTVNAPSSPFTAKFDFGTAKSLVESGYRQVTPLTKYTSTLGYGWQGGTISGSDRGSGTALDRDLNLTADGTFVVDVPNGSYAVTLRLGDAGAVAHDQMAIYLEGTSVGTVSTAAREVLAKVYQVTVSDGQLTVRLKDLGGRDKNVAVTGLTVASVVTASAAGVRSAATNAPEGEGALSDVVPRALFAWAPAVAGVPSQDLAASPWAVADDVELPLRGAHESRSEETPAGRRGIWSEPRWSAGPIAGRSALQAREASPAGSYDALFRSLGAHSRKPRVDSDQAFTARISPDGLDPDLLDVLAGTKWF